MKSCGRCGRERVVAVALDDSMEVCGHIFTARLPATRCEACGGRSARAAVLCSFVLAKLEERPAALDCLTVLREPRKLARKVRVSIGDSQTAKALQFGSAARSAPATA
jgi:hypothetical protein